MSSQLHLELAPPAPVEQASTSVNVEALQMPLSKPDASDASVRVPRRAVTETQPSLADVTLQAPQPVEAAPVVDTSALSAPLSKPVAEAPGEAAAPDAEPAAQQAEAEPEAEPADTATPAKRRASVRQTLYDADTRLIDGTIAAYAASKERVKARTKSTAGRLAVAASTVRTSSVKLKQSAPAPSTMKLPKGTSKKVLAGAALAVGQSLKQTPAKLKPLDDKAFALKDKLRSRTKKQTPVVAGSTWAFDISSLPQTRNASTEVEPVAGPVAGPSKKERLAQKLKDRNIESVSDAAYYLPNLAWATATTRLAELNGSKSNESLYANKKYLIGAAIGIIGVGVSTVLRLNGAEGVDEITQVAQGTGSGNAPQTPFERLAANGGITAGAVEAGTTQIEPGKPISGLAGLEAAADAQEQEMAVTVEAGDGFGDLIKEEFAADGIELNASEIYEIYKDMDTKLDGQLITGDTYEMANGDRGISSQGNFAWQQQAHEMLEQIKEAEKKKQGLS